MAVFQGDIRHVGGVDVSVGHDVRCFFMCSSCTATTRHCTRLCRRCAGAATKRHDCARPSVWESRARSRQHHALLLRPAPRPIVPGREFAPGTGVNRLTFAPGQKSLSRYAISGHFREPGQANPQSPHTPTNRVGRIQPIPRSTYCPGSHVKRLMFIPGQRELPRYVKNTRFRKPRQ